MKTLTELAAVLLLAGFAGAGCKREDVAEAPDSGHSAFCLAFAQKLEALACRLGGSAGDIVFICSSGLGADKTCQTPYETLLLCQMNTASCAADGSIDFGPCKAENEALRKCLRPSSDAGVDGDSLADLPSDLTADLTADILDGTTDLAADGLDGSGDFGLDATSIDSGLDSAADSELDAADSERTSDGAPSDSAPEASADTASGFETSLLDGAGD